MNESINQQWVPVDERLPGEAGMYLVTVQFVSGAADRRVEYYRGNGTWDVPGYRPVIAWMPLPEPFVASRDE